MTTTKSMKYIKTFSCLSIPLILTSIFFISTGYSQNNNEEIQNSLVNIHNKYFSDINFQDNIKYPKTTLYKLAWAGLVISIAEDFACVLTVGHSEVGVTIIENSLNAVDVGINTAKILIQVNEEKFNAAAGEVATSVGTSLVHKKIGIPIVRTGVSVYGVFKAGNEEERRVANALAEQTTILQFIGDFMPEIKEIKSKISLLQDGYTKTEFQQIVAAMIKRKAELSVYHQLTKQTFTGDAGKSLDVAIWRAINPGAIQPTMNFNLVQKVNDYIEGHLSEEHFTQFLESEIQTRIMPIQNIKSSKIISQLSTELSEIRRRRTELTKYNNNSITILKYRQLQQRIPKNYRILANIKIHQLPPDIANTINISTPNQGTYVDPSNQQNINSHIDQIDFLVLFHNNGLHLIKTVPKNQKNINYDIDFDLVKGENTVRVFLLDIYQPGMGVEILTESNILEAGEPFIYNANLELLDLHLTLSWDTDRTDVDLHLVPGTMSNFGRSGVDCHYRSKKPKWGTSANNPELDIDDTNGHGPENIIVKSLKDGKYFAVVHYYASRGKGKTKASLIMRVKGRQPINYGPIELIRDKQKVQVITLTVVNGVISSPQMNGSGDNEPYSAEHQEKPELDWSARKGLDMIVYDSYGKGYSTQPKLVGSTYMTSYSWQRQFRGDFIFFPKKNVLWFDFKDILTSEGFYNDFKPVITLPFRPRWIRIFQAKETNGNYHVKDISFEKNDNLWIAKLGRINTDSQFYGLPAWKAVVEVGLPEFSGKVYWNVVMSLEEDLPAGQRFFNWMSQKVFSTFLAQLEVLGEVNTPGQISDIYEVYLERNMTDNVVNKREYTLKEKAKTLWNWLSKVKSFIPSP